MPTHQYEPIVIGVTMSQYGYWITEISVTPWQRMAIMVCQVGITPDEAKVAALASISPALVGKQRLCPTLYPVTLHGHTVAPLDVEIRMTTLS